MSQYNSTGNRSGQSRAKGSTRTASKGQGNSNKSKQTPIPRSNSVYKARKGSSRNHRPHYDYKKIFIGGVILMVAIAAIVFLVKGMGKDRNGSDLESIEEMETTIEDRELQKEVTVDGITITGMSRENAKNEILKYYPWSMAVTYGGEIYEVTNLMAEKVDELLTEIYTGEPQESYVLDTLGLEEKIEQEVQVICGKWNQKAVNGSISSYDTSTNTFIFSGAKNGFAINSEKLTADITGAVDSKKFDMVIAAVGDEVKPEVSEADAREKYKTIGTFTTTTTANSNRNNNIKLASNILNGTIVQPGEEFSFNDTVGERTEAKGYKGAAAYNNGLVVEEIGGGVCQVSSTLYNAVLKSGLKTTVRRSHTFEPSYVTPGTDATISWGGPDYKFMNTSNSAIGIRASYADQKVTISIYGIPVIEDGVTYSLLSKKTKDIDSPAPTYEEDQSLELDEERTKTNGSMGSYWETRLVIKKGNDIISQEVIHNTTYKGHAAVILRNTSGIVVTTAADQTTIDALEPASEGAGDGFIEPDSPLSTTAAATADNETTTVSGPGASTQSTAVNPAQQTTKAPAGPGSSAANSTSPTSAASTTAAPTVVAPGSTTAAESSVAATVSPNPISGGSQTGGNGPGQ